MAILTKSDPNRFTVAQQKEITERCNEAYDRGGADVLKLTKETVENLKEQFSDNPANTAALNFFLTIIEGIRQQLEETVKQSQAEAAQEESRIISV